MDNTYSIPEDPEGLDAFYYNLTLPLTSNLTPRAIDSTYETADRPVPDLSSFRPPIPTDPKGRLRVPEYDCSYYQLVCFMTYKDFLNRLETLNPATLTRAAAEDAWHDLITKKAKEARENSNIPNSEKKGFLQSKAHAQMRGKGLKDFDVEEFWRRRGDFTGPATKRVPAVSNRRISKVQKRKPRRQSTNAMWQHKDNPSSYSFASMHEGTSQYYGRTRATSIETNLHFGGSETARREQNNVGIGLRMDIPIRGGRDAQAQDGMSSFGLSSVAPTQQYDDEDGGATL